jgi:septum formation protein
MTAFVLLDSNGQTYTSQVVTSQVTFKVLADTQIQDYLATGEPVDKAGAYAVQGLGRTFIERVEGSYNNVVGLPLDEVLAVLRDVGLANHGTTGRV